MVKYVAGYALTFGALGALDSLVRSMNSATGESFDVGRVVTFFAMGALGGAIVGRKRKVASPG